MTNRGLLAAREQWKYYRPVCATAGSSGLVQPSFDAGPTLANGNPYQFGRYVRDPDTNFVTAEIQFATVGATTLGEGAAWVFSLPVPARRTVELDASTRNCPVPIGTGLCYWSFVPVPNANVPCIVTLADAFPSLAGGEDSWVQLYAPYILSWGSESTRSGTDAVTARAGFPVNARDVEIVQTNGALTAAQSCPVVTTSSDTTFTVRNRAGSAPGSAWTFDWKIRAEPPAGQTGALVGPGTVSAADRIGCVPWDWSRFTSLGPFGNVFIQLGYEAA